MALHLQATCLFTQFWYILVCRLPPCAIFWYTFLYILLDFMNVTWPANETYPQRNLHTNKTDLRKRNGPWHSALYQTLLGAVNSSYMQNDYTEP